MNETNETVLLTREEVADMLFVKPRTVDHYRRIGLIPAVTLNPRATRKMNYKYDRAAIVAYINKNKTDAKET